MLKRLACTMLILAILLSCIPVMAEEEYTMPYWVEVDLTNQVTTVYRTSDGAVMRQMICSTGMNDSTHPGTWKMPLARKRKKDRTEWYWFKKFHCYAKFVTRIHHDILFHSVPFASKDNSTINEQAVKDLGNAKSHGCIRLMPQEAQWIAENLLPGTKVVVFRNEKVDPGLAELLRPGAFVAEDGVSYEDFIGVSRTAGVLGYGSNGDEVMELQQRLRSLGYYAGDMNGEYLCAMVLAVEQFQADNDLPQNGLMTDETRAMILTDDAATATHIELTEGLIGACVKSYQSALADLGLYSGELDGIYDADVIAASNQFQSIYGCDPTTNADTELQEAVYYEHKRVSEAFNGESFTAELQSEAIPMARIDAPTSIRLRQKDSTESEALDLLKDGEYVYILEEGSKWTQVRFGQKTGYIKNKYLKREDRANIVIHYTANGTVGYTLGHTLEEYTNGASSPAVEFDEMYRNTILPAATAQEATVTVQTGIENAVLNLRAEPSSEGAVLAELPNGTVLPLIERGEEWTTVRYAGSEAYLMTAYLEFSSATSVTSSLIETDGDDEDEEEEDEPLYADVCTENADVYQEDDGDSEVIGALPLGTTVEVISADEDTGWVLIDWQGHQGYMRDTDLSFEEGADED